MDASGPRFRDLIVARAAEDPQRVAYVEGRSGHTLTWGDVRGSVDGWERLADHQAPGARVGLLAADPLAMIASFLGALGAGVLAAPLDPGATPSELAAQARRLGLHAVVSDEDSVPLTDGMELGDRWVTGAAGPVPSPLAAGGAAPLGARGAGLDEDIALILASSGTTGAPKIIPLTAQALLATAEAVAEGHGLDSRSVGYSPLPLFHINGLVVGVLSTLVTGGRLVVDRRFSAGRFWTVAAEQEVTWLNLVPAIIAILSERDAPPPAVRARIGFARSASAPLPAATCDRFEQRCGIGILETYGMTEAASQIAANPRNPSGRRPGSVGQPVAVELRVVDRAGTVVEPDEIGQVQIRGPRVVRSYWSPAGSDGPPSRDAAGADGWLATGDLGRVDGDGFVFLVGRIDDVINRGGEKVFPREVEEVLLADPAVSAAAVVGRPHPTVGEEPVAFVIAADGAEVTRLAERLTERCSRNLSRFKRPAEIVVADSLPSGPTGKIRHAELRHHLADAAPISPPPACTT